jgi:predicted nucleic acid-binding protein
MAVVTLCLDTNILIDHLKGREPGSRALSRALREYRCGITVITAYEVLYGMARSRRSIGEEALTDALPTLPMDKQAAGVAAHLHAELIHRNQDIGVKDTLIAAICLRYSVPILTANAKHFSRVDSLVVIDPANWT